MWQFRCDAVSLGMSYKEALLIIILLVYTLLGEKIFYCAVLLVYHGSYLQQIKWSAIISTQPIGFLR
jgi:hypothetical protein